MEMTRKFRLVELDLQKAKQARPQLTYQGIWCSMQAVLSSMMQKETVPDDFTVRIGEVGFARFETVVTL